MTAVYEKAPAKINLMLDVLRRRDDGYHELETVMTMVDLADRLELTELAEDRVELVSPSPAIPLDERNLAHQAARLVKERFGVTRGVRIALDKRVPVSAGLAGGSSDAAAVLRALNRMWRLGLKGEELEALGAELGSDVPYCVRGGTVLARGRGEILESLPSPPPCWVVLAKPPVSVSTADVFSRLNLEEIEDHPSAGRLIDALARRSFPDICRGLGNVLEHVTLRLHPEIRQIKACMEKMGADGVLMSGSGPTVFGLVAREAKAIRIANGLRGFCREVYAVRLLAEPAFRPD